ncbi:MAG: hypothetical protein AB4063_04580 [Crocosphaera sp.]
MTNQPTKTQWQYLESRQNSWRKQLYIKGRKLTAFGVWSDMMVNGDTLEETADNWEIPLEAVQEVIEYCEAYQDLITAEADSERRYLEERGVPLEPKVIH